jgi:AcrR family transcriptional regulator
MAPEERRAALVAATVPLLREHGMAVSTRQIAEAAGVAEGTIFGVFPDKASLLRAAVISAFDPEPLVDAMTGVAGQGDLRTRLREVVKLLRWRLSANEPLIAATRTVAAEPDQTREFLERMQHARRRMLEGIAAVIEPDAARLRRDPRSAARLLLMLVMASVHSGLGGQPNALSDLDADEIVSLLLDGLLVRAAQPEEMT